MFNLKQNIPSVKKKFKKSVHLSKIPRLGVPQLKCPDSKGLISSNKLPSPPFYFCQNCLIKRTE